MQPLFDKVDEKAEETRVQLNTIKSRWFEALDMQAETERLQARIVKKLDKVSEVQNEVA